MNKLIAEIMKVAVEKNKENKNTIFVRFSGHIHSISVDVHTKGWKTDEKPDYHADAYLHENEKIQKILDYLKGLED